MKIGFIGLGLMGEPMCSNIIKKGNEEVYVYDTNYEKIKVLEKKGAYGCTSSKEVAEKSDVIITMVPKSEHVKAVHESLYDEVRTGQIYIDMSTIDPNISIQLAKKIKELGAEMIDAPVVKSRPAAIDGTLGIYVGGDVEVFQKVKFILERMGSNIIHMGSNGTGAVMKIAHNILVGGIQNTVNEILLLAEKANIIIDDFIRAISYGGGQNFYLDSKGHKIAQRNFETAFSVENMHKDVHLAKKLMKDFNLNLPMINHVCDVYDEALNSGFKNEDFSASFKVIEQRNK